MSAYVGISTLTLSNISPTIPSRSLGAFDLIIASMRVNGTRLGSFGVYALWNQTPMPHTPTPGIKAPSIDQEFFGDIVVWPRSIDMGLVLSAKSFTVGVWNLTGYMQRMTTWAVMGLDGVSVVNADGYPTNFGPTQYRNYQVNVAASGQASINGAITFNFMAKPSMSVTLTGTRLIVFSFEPNWRDPISENLEWLTDVLTAFNGREQRLQLRSNPRRAMKYLLMFETPNKVATFESMLWGWQHLAFAVPIWTDRTNPTAPVAIGAITISASTTLRDFAATRMALLWRNYRTWEVVEIQSLTAAQLTLTKATQQAWTTADRLIPIRLGRMAASIEVSRPTGTIAEASITFSLEPDTATDSARLGTSAPTQYKGLDVLLTPPAVDGNQTDDFERDMPATDYNTGAWAIKGKTDAPVVKRPYHWILTSRQEIMNFLMFLESHKGQLIPFWVPTWSQDLELLQDVGATDVGIVVSSILYTQQIKHHPNRSDIILWPGDGSAPVLRGITASSETVSNTEILTMDSALGTLRSKTYFKAISFLTLCRFAADGFEIVWHTDSVAEVAADLKEVLQ